MQQVSTSVAAGILPLQLISYRMMRGQLMEGAPYPIAEGVRGGEN